jgi:hypothetical protein
MIAQRVKEARLALGEQYEALFEEHIDESRPAHVATTST